MARRILSSAQHHPTPATPLPRRVRRLRRPRRPRFHVNRRLIPAFLVFASLIGLIYRGCVHHNETGTDANSPAATRSLSGVTVILDPGHGGTDSGARDDGLREDVLNYRLTSTVAAVLRTRGASVIYTVASDALVNDLREGQPEPPMEKPSDAVLVFDNEPIRLRPDRDPADLYRRAALASRIWHQLPASQQATGHGIYFLALHCDKLETATGRGARVYFDSRSGEPSRLAWALKRRLTAADLTNSAKGAPIPRHYGVLNPLYNPIPESVLLEMLTISNARDRRAVLDPPWRWRLAHLIADAIGECEGPGR